MISEKEFKCPICSGKRFSSLGLDDNRVEVIDGDTTDWESDEVLLNGSLVYCRECDNNLIWKKRKWVKATREDLLEEGIKFMEVVIGDELKREDFDIIKNLKILSNLENDNN